MNIGILIPGFSAHEGDWCIPVYLNFVRELAKKHHVRVFPIRYPFTNKPYEIAGAYVFPFGGGSYTAQMGRWQILWEVERVIKRHHRARPFDVLHAIWADETGHITNRIGKSLGIPTVVSVAGGELVGFKNIRYGLQLGKMTRWLVYQALKNASAVIAPSVYSAKMIRAYAAENGLDHLLNRQNLHMIPLGVDTELFKPPDNLKVERPYEFLHVASLTPVKRQDILLHLLAKMPTSHLHIIGEGDLRPYLENLSESLKIRDRIIFHGDISHDQLHHYYQAAQYLVMTSQHEAFGMAALEAFACGAGVLGTGVGVLPEIGLVAPFGDLDSLLQLVIGRERHLTPQHVQERAEVVRQYYSIDHMTAEIVGLYESVLGTS